MKTVKEVAKTKRVHPNRVRKLCKARSVKKIDGAYLMTEAEAKRIAKAL